MLKNSFLILSIFCLYACQPQSKQTDQKLYVFGTIVNITIWHDNPRQTQQALTSVSELFKQMHTQWHAWKPGRLHDINQKLRAGETVQLSHSEIRFYTRVIELSRQSNHLFNPTIGELINIWGFHTDTYPITTPPPPTQDIEHLTNQQLSVDNLNLVQSYLSSNNRRIWLDFGGIAKGLAVDKAIQIIQQHGIENAIVNAGGDLRAIGHKQKRNWHIGIQSPTDKGVVAALDVLGNEAIFTSGNYQRYKEFNGQRYAHILDSRTGFPIKDILSVTVIAKDGITADAAATALAVAGLDNWQLIARQMGVEHVLIIARNNQCQATPNMLKRLRNLHLTCQELTLN